MSLRSRRPTWRREKRGQWRPKEQRCEGVYGRYFVVWCQPRDEYSYRSTPLLNHGAMMRIGLFLFSLCRQNQAKFWQGYRASDEPPIDWYSVRSTHFDAFLGPCLHSAAASWVGMKVFCCAASSVAAQASQDFMGTYLPTLRCMRDKSYIAAIHLATLRKKTAESDVPLVL